MMMLHYSVCLVTNRFQSGQARTSREEDEPDRISSLQPLYFGLTGFELDEATSSAFKGATVGLTCLLLFTV